MTNVYLKQNGDRFTVSCQGHATGSPEVCAAASCLVHTLCGWLRNTSIEVVEEVLDDNADAKIQFRGGLAAETAFDMICIGFLQLAKTEQDYICVNYEII